MRRQITLFVPTPYRTMIDSVRRRHNPRQSELIGAHVTLCRDDEVEKWQELQERIQGLESGSFRLMFDLPKKDGNWVGLPVLGSTSRFHDLRKRILDDPACRESSPHITIVHPRNGTCSDQAFKNIVNSIPRMEIEFTDVSFIEQHESEPWRVLLTLPIPKFRFPELPDQIDAP